MIKEALDSGALSKPYQEFEGGCCAHCSGHPAAVIPAGFVDGESLFFEGEEYQRFWGDARSRGSRSWQDPETGQRREHQQASREQVEDAIKLGVF